MEVSNNQLPATQTGTYTINQFTTDEGIKFFTSFPGNYNNDINRLYEIFISFPGKALNELSKRELIDLIETVLKANANGILILPMINAEELEEAAMENDNKKFGNLYKKIKPMTEKVYNIVISSNNSVKQAISIIEMNDTDKKFGDWMEIMMPQFIKGIPYKKLYEQTHSMDTTKNEPSNVKSGIAPVNHDYDQEAPEKQKTNARVKKLVKVKTSSNAAFSSMSFIILVLGMAFVFGISIAYLLIK